MREAERGGRLLAQIMAAEDGGAWRGAAPRESAPDGEPLGGSGRWRRRRDGRSRRRRGPRFLPLGF